MPVRVNTHAVQPVCSAGNESHSQALALGARSNICLQIGLLNNMPDAALKATERQFVSLLDAASEGLLVELSFYHLQGVPRGSFAAQSIQHTYRRIDTHSMQPLDGLIVTGAEPIEESLSDEPYWDAFGRMLAWAEDHTCSTIFSCLAAHAALLKADGIQRIRNHTKRFGIFQCSQVSDHAIMRGLSQTFDVPHSRWNGIAEEDLATHGYSVLTRTSSAEIDAFVKQGKSLFVFFQGHPEYAPDTLLREYRRDVERYFRRETEMYPSVPQDYFDQKTAEALRARESLSAKTALSRAAILEALRSARTSDTWRTSAVCLYKNWLEYLSLEKARRLTAKIASPCMHP